MKYLCSNEGETYQIGKRLAKKIKPGDVLGLVGDLGAGKTVFTKGLASGLGVKFNVNSPTFVLMKVYPFIKDKKAMNFVHIDAYRLSKADELQAIGLDEYMGKNNSIVVIEWADRVKKILPEKAIIIDIKHTGEGDKRLITVS